MNPINTLFPSRIIHAPHIIGIFGVVVAMFSTTATANALVEKVTGKVYTTHVTRVKPVVVHQQLKPGDQFSTGDNGRATLRINKNCQVEVPPSHFVHIKSLEVCPSALPIRGSALGNTATSAGKGTKVATAAKNSGTVIAATAGTASSLTMPLILGAVAVIAVASDNNKSSPD